MSRFWLKIPASLSPRHSFFLTRTEPLFFGTATDAAIKERIELANDDMNRLRYACPIFPLRDDHLNSKRLDGRRARCMRNNRPEPDGRYWESAFCDTCGRNHYSHAPTLRARPNATQFVGQRPVGHNIVTLCAIVVIPGWFLLYQIATNAPASWDLIRAASRGQVVEFAK